MDKDKIVFIKGKQCPAGWADLLDDVIHKVIEQPIPKDESSENIQQINKYNDKNTTL